MHTRCISPETALVRLGRVARTPLAQTSVRDALDSALIALTAAGCDTPRLDAELLVDRRVLIPRPETEHLVEAALDLPQGARVADVGTGSGAVALALKAERPDLRVVATDASRAALDVARANARRLGLELELLEGDLLGPVEGPLDAVLSNPPYVADADRGTLAPDITRHEPP